MAKLVDATFKLVSRPFYQLFSVHAFVQSGTSLKQVPLVFVMMSSRSQADYDAVFRTILEILPNPPSVVKVVADFEAATWLSLRVVLPNVEVKGCLFHFTQAVFRKIQSLGLQRAYNVDAGTLALCKNFMALPLLPHEHIHTVFDQLVAGIGEDVPALRELSGYIQDTWINGNIFSPVDWSVFGQAIRTNNDVEGWHYRMNHRGKRAKLPFYLMVYLLHREACLVTIQAVLVYREDLTRRQRAGSAGITARLHVLWDEYSQGQRSARSLLSAGSHLISPKL